MSVYDHFAADFDHTRYSVWTGVRNFLDNLEPYALVADVGCGNGKNSVYRRDICVFANDLSKELTDLSYQKHKKNRCSFLIADGLQLPYKDNTFDACMSIAVIHHIKDPKKRYAFVKELLRIVRPGGTVLVSVWAAEQPIKPKWKNISGTDYLIPWHAKDGAVHDRFYHLYTRDDIDATERSLGGEGYGCSITYEKDNWFIKVVKPSS